MLTRFSKWILLGCIVSLLISLQLFNLQTSQAAAKSTISFYVFGDLAEKAAYQTLVTAFNAKYPDITVNMVYTQGEDEFHSLNGEDEYRSRLSLDFASGKPPAVFLMNYREYGIFGEKGQLEQLGSYLAQSKVVQADDFYPQALAAFTRNNVLDCVPQNLSGTVVYYNKDLFQKAKVDFPQAGWNWDDFLKTAQALTNSTTKQYGLGLYAAAAVHLAEWRGCD